MRLEDLRSDLHRNERGFSASIPCTCGELFQGTLEGEPCLVSCSVDLFSAACTQDGRTDFQEPGEKTRTALSRLPDHISIPDDMGIRNDLPLGRGFGTSTADIGAALSLACAHSGVELSPEELSGIAVSVEPTDSTIFPGLTVFAHKNAKFHQILGSAPQADILILDPGGFIGSLVFNARDWSRELGYLAQDYRSAFEILKAGIADNDLAAVGSAATLSARLHQSILKNDLLENVIEISGYIHAAGVCRAHSGTILGLLLEPGREDNSDIIAFCRKRLPAKVQYRTTSLADGGARYALIHENQREELRI